MPRTALTPAALLVSALLVAGSGLSWTLHTIGDTGNSTNLDLDVGDGDRNGKDEVYVATLGGLKIFKWDGYQWLNSSVWATDGSSVAVGDGDRDGLSEVYFGSFDGSLRRFAWNGSDWTRNRFAILPVGEQTGGIAHVVLGDIENDGKVEVFASTGPGDIYKLWKDQGVWSKKRIAQLASPTTEMRLGDGDRDGLNELYAGVSAGYVYQVEHQGNQVFETTLVGSVTNTSTWVTGLALGNAKHASQGEVYASDSNQQMFRFVWNLTTHTWFKQTIGWTHYVAERLTTHDFDGDGRTEIYAGSQGGWFYRFLWNGTDWQRSTILTGGEGTTGGLDAGDADRDGKTELYAANTQDEDPVYKLEP